MKIINIILNMKNIKFIIKNIISLYLEIIKKNNNKSFISIILRCLINKKKIIKII